MHKEYFIPVYLSAEYRRKEGTAMQYVQSFPPQLTLVVRSIERLWFLAFRDRRFSCCLCLTFISSCSLCFSHSCCLCCSASLEKEQVYTTFKFTEYFFGLVNHFLSPSHPLFHSLIFTSNTVSPLYLSLVPCYVLENINTFLDTTHFTSTLAFSLTVSLSHCLSRKSDILASLLLHLLLSLAFLLSLCLQLSLSLHLSLQFLLSSSFGLLSCFLSLCFLFTLSKKTNKSNI